MFLLMQRLPLRYTRHYHLGGVVFLITVLMRYQCSDAFWAEMSESGYRHRTLIPNKSSPKMTALMKTVPYDWIELGRNR